MPDYYAILGVGKTADDKEIKSAFRKLAMKWHPDKNPGNAEAEKKFKEINEAYETLKDPNKRAEYDNPRPQFDFRSNGGFDRQHFGFGNPFDDPFFEELLRNVNRRQTPKNKDVHIRYNVTLEESFLGKEVDLNYTVNGTSKSVHVSIPKSIFDGAKIRFTGQGETNIPNIPPGDLYIIINVLSHDRFIRQHDAVITSLTIDFIDAILGTNKQLKCIDGSEIDVRVPAGLIPGNHLKVAEKGFYHGDKRGPMLVEIVFTQPTLTEDQLKLLATLKN
jgi:DnaJ-class molecular chaperone